MRKWSGHWRAVADSSRMTRIGLIDSLGKMEWKKEESLIELFAYIDKQVAAAYLNMIYSDPRFVD